MPQPAGPRPLTMVVLGLAAGVLGGCSQAASVRSTPERLVTCAGQTLDAPAPLPLVERAGAGRRLVVRVLDEQGEALPGASVEVDGRRAVSGLDGVAVVGTGRRLSVRYLGFWGIEARLRSATRDVVVRLLEQGVESFD